MIELYFTLSIAFYVFLIAEKYNIYYHEEYFEIELFLTIFCKYPRGTIRDTIGRASPEEQTTTPLWIYEYTAVCQLSFGIMSSSTVIKNEIF